MNTTRAPDRPPKRPTINDIARLARVSKKTVSRVINNSPLVRGDTRDRIEAVIREHGYVPDPQARGLSLGRSVLVGLVYADPDPQYLVALQLGLAEGLRDAGFQLAVHPCEGDSPALVDAIRRFVEGQRLYGVALAPPLSEDGRILGMLRDIGCSHVRVLPGAPGAPPPRHIGRMAALRLIGRDDEEVLPILVERVPPHTLGACGLSLR